MNDYQLASLISGLVLLVAIGARYALSRPSSRMMRDAMYWVLIIAVIGLGYGIYSLVAA